jgi:hypothetical protein
MPSSERLSKQPWSRSFALLITGLELHRHGPLVTVVVPWHILQTSSKLPARPHPSWRQRSPAQVMGEPPRPATYLVRKRRHAHAGRWVRGSNPLRPCSAGRGSGRERAVTCRFFVPVVTARARRDPHVTNAVRTQSGPMAPRVTLGGGCPFGAAVLRDRKAERPVGPRKTDPRGNHLWTEHYRLPSEGTDGRRRSPKRSPRDPRLAGARQSREGRRASRNSRQERAARMEPPART